MCTGLEAAVWVTGLIAAAGTSYSIYSGEQNRKAQSEANDKTLAEMKKQTALAEEDTNRANAKTPSDTLSAAQQAAKGGVSGTMLTGTQGVSSSNLSLGKSSLLGS